MATLEDAAEALVVKLRGLDSEIEESEGTLEDLRERVDAVIHDVEQEWTALVDAASELLRKVHDEQEHLADQTQQTLQAVADAQDAVAENGAGARQQIADGSAQVDALGHHAAGLEPEVESLAAEGGEAPARSLAERAHELQQELARLAEESRDFLQDEVANAAADAADEMRLVGDTLHSLLTETVVGALQQVYDDWESMVSRLEDYVVTQGYDASHQHAREVVEYAIEECETACRHQLDDLHLMVDVLLGQLKEMVSEVEESADRLVAQAGADLLQDLERTHTGATAAVAALDQVRQELAAYSFVEV